MTQHRRSIHSTTQLLSKAAEASVKTEEAGASVKTEEPEAEPEELTEVNPPNISRRSPVDCSSVMYGHRSNE